MLGPEAEPKTKPLDILNLNSTWDTLLVFLTTLVAIVNHEYTTIMVVFQPDSWLTIGVLLGLLGSAVPNATVDHGLFGL